MARTEIRERATTNETMTGNHLDNMPARLLCGAWETKPSGWARPALLRFVKVIHPGGITFLRNKEKPNSGAARCLDGKRLTNWDVEPATELREPLSGRRKWLPTEGTVP